MKVVEIFIALFFYDYYDANLKKRYETCKKMQIFFVL